MPAERDLARMLASIDIEQRPGSFAFVTGEWPGLVASAHAIVEESEGRTYVVATADARSVGAPVEYESAWLTLTVWSSLQSVGLTAAISRALAAEDIACNVLAGFHHDHLLVPIARVDDAVRVLRALSSG
ncbi:MAG: ACT domain-containing protein [Ilumatobacteraceae bacterium]